MQDLKRVFWGILISLGVVWWTADHTLWGSLEGVFAWRNVLSQYTGVLGIGVMSLAIMLAMRPLILERYLGGLDKMYRLHKWLGIAGLVISISHWLIAKGPKWLVGLGWLERPLRRQRPVFPEGSLRQFLMDQRGLAETIGEWAFYLAVALMVLALLKKFPYHRFFQTHRFLAVTYLALVIHSVVLLKFEYWNSVLGIVLGGLIAGGSVCAVMSLLRKHGGGARVAGHVLAIEYQVRLHVTAIDLQLEAGWPGHQSGQFAFATFHEDEGPHPFTIASCWNKDGRIRFLVKALGDYTRSLPDRLHVGDVVQLEGPYGQFNFKGTTSRQIWIGGGIGITPFIARMKELARHGDGKTIDLFHTTATYDPLVIDQLAHDAAAAKVSLHVFWDARDGRLDLERLVRMVPDWATAEVWFCGPAKFGQLIRDGLLARGFPAAHFQQELFEMR